MEKQKLYLAIDLKSFYASVECVERGLDPLKTNLVVADPTRTEKTICLAVSPSLKAYGIPGRARMFEVIQKVSEANAVRRSRAPGRTFTGKSCFDPELKENPSLELDYIVAPPRMAHYMEHSAKIFETYLKYVAPEDIHVYSIDEVFMDITPYLKSTGLSAWDFARTIIHDVLGQTGITATAGIGTNLYLCKIAMDIVAKHAKPDEFGVRMAQLDERTYRQFLWTHRPLTDFWRLGRGYARKLEEHGMHTMGDVARCSLHNEDLLYKLFGINAELLIDHAWGWEPCTLADIKAYRPSTTSLCSGQVLQEAYTNQKAGLVIREMADMLSMDLVDKGLYTDQLVMTIQYDIENLTNPDIARLYNGPIMRDGYGKEMPQAAHGTVNLGTHTASTAKIVAAAMELFGRITNENLLVRKLNITANHLLTEQQLPKDLPLQLNLFEEPKPEEDEAFLLRERRRQETVLQLRKRFGKNAVLKGMNLEEGATARERNVQIGGHKA